MAIDLMSAYFYGALQIELQGYKDEWESRSVQFKMDIKHSLSKSHQTFIITVYAKMQN